MKSGLLRNKITFLKPQLIKNDYGSNQDITYNDYKTVNAYVIYVGGNKSINNYEMFASQSVQFQIRYRTDIKEDFQIKFNEKLYTILNIKEVGWKDSLTITADLIQN